MRVVRRSRCTRRPSRGGSRTAIAVLPHFGAKRLDEITKSDIIRYLLEHFGHARQAASLRPLARKAKSLKPLDPSVRLVASLLRSAGRAPEAPAWKLSLNVPLEIDA